MDMRPLVTTRMHNIERQRRSGPGCRVVAAIFVAVVMLLAQQPQAHAQIVALVGGEPITAIDIAHRTRLIQLSTQKAPSRQEVLDELIDDKLKVQLSKRYIAEVPKREIENAYINIARRAGMTVAQFNKMLESNGMNADTLKTRIHADYVWGQIVRGKFQGSLQVGEKDVEVKLQASHKEESGGMEFKLRPVLFLVPKGSAPPAFEARKREAETWGGRC